MSFSGELQGFIQAFQVGQSIIKSPQEREAEALDLRTKRAQATTAEYDASPEALQLKRDSEQASTRNTQAIATVNEANARDANDPALRAQTSRDRESSIASRDASAGVARETARGMKTANDREDMIQQNIRESLKAAGIDPGAPVAPQQGTQGAIPDGSSTGTAPGPTSLNTPRGMRNNNPLNIEAGNFTQGQQGYTGSDGRFAQFSDLNGGLAAADTLLTHYGNTGINTVAGVVGKWAPSSDGNDVSAYAQHVASSLGVGPNDQINLSDPAVRQKMIGAMAQVENGQSLPAGYMGAQADSAGQSAIAGTDKGNNTSPSLIDSGHTAVREGLTALAQKFGLNQDSAVPDQNAEQGQTAFLTGAGGADHAQVTQAEDTVQKMAGHTLTPAERTIYTLGATYEAYSAAGEPDKAKAAAQSLLGYYQQLSARWGAVAKAAASDGKIDDATKAAVKAYAAIPDGNDLSITKTADGQYQVQVTDVATKKVVTESLMTPEEIGAMALKISPSTFVDTVMRAAGVRTTSQAYQQSLPGPDGAIPENPNYAGMQTTQEVNSAVAMRKVKADKGPKAPSFADRTEITGALDESLNLAVQSVGVNDRPDPKTLSGMKSIAYQLYTTNSMTPDDAANAVMMITSVDKSNPDTPQFKVTPGSNGENTVTLSDGTSLSVSDEQLTRLAMLRQQQVEVAKQRIALTGARNDRNQRALDILKQGQSKMSVPGVGQRLFSDDSGQAIPLPFMPSN